MKALYDWEIELCWADGRREIIRLSEYDRVVDECGTVPLSVTPIED